MRRRLMVLTPWLLAASFSILAPSPAAAQWRATPAPHHHDSAFSNGFEDGYRAGLNDGRRANRYDPAGERWYRKADRRYGRHYGPKEHYRQEYRVGFRAGYRRGYREAWSSHRRGYLFFEWDRDGRSWPP